MLFPHAKSNEGAHMCRRERKRKHHTTTSSSSSRRSRVTTTRALGARHLYFFFSFRGEERHHRRCTQREFFPLVPQQSVPSVVGVPTCSRVSPSSRYSPARHDNEPASRCGRRRRWLHHPFVCSRPGRRLDPCGFRRRRGECAPGAGLRVD